MDCVNCKYEKVIEKIQEDVRDLFSKINNSIIRQTSIEGDVKYLISAINEMKAKIDILASIPGKRWETIIASIIAAIIGLAVGRFF